MDLESRILEVISQNPNIVTTSMLLAALPGSNNAMLVDPINSLSAQDKIQICHKGKQLAYKLKQSSGSLYRGADIEEKLIYQLIEKSGNKGIWMRDLRIGSNLHQQSINKILKNLENKKLIKSVSSVASQKKKFYMLYNIEPDRSVTGGTWYSDQEFDIEFVDCLNQQCYKYLMQAKIEAAAMSSDPFSQRNSSLKSSKDICDYINGLKLSKVQLTLQDIENILDTLVYDAKVEKVRSPMSSGDPSEHLYRVTRPLISSCGLMRVPCGACPVFSQCKVGSPISPLTCPYMKEWMNF